MKIRWLALPLLFAGFLLAQQAHYYTGADDVLLPDPKLTPGVADTRVTQANIQQTICKPGYTATVRNVPEKVKKQVAAAYGVDLHDGVKYEIDHLISLEIGGSNDAANLWPQPYENADDPPGAHTKDKLENELHRQVCRGEISLKEAQSRISINWYQAYKEMARQTAQ